MMKLRGMLIVPVTALAALAATPAWAFDEDTCAPPDGGWPGDGGVPSCADQTPLQGRAPRIAFDHSVSHWEMTYLIARCVGLDDGTAQVIAAANAATDMSSPTCGSTINNAASGGQLYMSGYACGYERAAGMAGDAGAVPAYPASLRWRHTDRCLDHNQPAGHAEMFHYSYWQTQTTTTIVALQSWAEGTTTRLVDPVKLCDIASDAGCPFTAPTSYEYPCRGTDGGCADRVCGWADAGEWVFPARARDGGVTWSSASPEDWKRVGIYLHALGDTYSHTTCQAMSNQPTIDGGYVLSASGPGPTTHLNYLQPTSTFPNSCLQFSPDGGWPDGGISRQQQCSSACSGLQHDCEFGSTLCSDPVVDAALREQTLLAFQAVWDRLATYSGRAANAQVQLWRDGFIEMFRNYDNSYDRQQFVRDNLASGPCTCAAGAYGWNWSDGGCAP